MPLYIPWLTETIKKRGVRYLLHHYLGQFFEEKLTLEQLSIDIYEGKGSIRNLALDVDGLNDELDFIPFKFLDGCSIAQISVEVPWSSLATEACKVELEGAKFVCRLKTSADATKAHCTESTLLSRSLMTSSMQMAEDIVTTEDDDDYDSPNSSVYRQHGQQTQSRRKDANQMFEGLEMFAQLIDSVLRRTKLTARNTLFQIQPHPDEEYEDSTDDNKPPSQHKLFTSSTDCNRSTSGDEFCEKASDPEDGGGHADSSEGTVEFFIEFFRCEEIIDESKSDFDGSSRGESNDENNIKRPLSAMPETVTKLLTLEDVEMRIGGKPVSNLIGKHTIMIKFNGQKSEISIFSGSPLLAVISHEQLKTFFNVFDSASDRNNEFSQSCEKNQKVMSSEDYAKIENQLLESACLRTNHQDHLGELGYVGSNNVSSQAGRRWVDSGELYTNMSRQAGGSEYNYQAPNSKASNPCLDGRGLVEPEPSLDNIQAFSCELKLPGIWLCILRHGEALPPLIKPYADSINSFQTINKYIDGCIKVPHIRLLALKVALDITASGINVFLGDLDISEHLQDDSMSPTLHLLHNDLVNFPMNSSRYKARIVNSKEITIDLLTKTRLLLDPTMIDRIVYDYKLIDFNRPKANSDQTTSQYNSQSDLNLVIRGDQFKVELLCPIPDLTPFAHLKPAQLRPQSFLFDFKNVSLSWQSDKLNVSVRDLIAYVKTRPQQSDSESIKFIQATSKNNDKIVLILEPSPTNLDTAFPSDIEAALNESSMQDSIYVGHSIESRIPKEAFQTKRKVVRASFQSTQSNGGKQKSGKVNDCDNEKILTPGDRQHLLDYLNQTVTSTKLSLSIHLPICEVEFEDKEQLDLIYNRFGNDFIFWQPRAFNKGTLKYQDDKNKSDKRDHRRDSMSEQLSDESQIPLFKQPLQEDDYSSSTSDDRDSEVSFHSLSIEGSGSYLYENEVTCKVTVDELLMRFNHQSCAAALKQEISVDNLLLGVVIDVNRKPGTLLSLVADNMELSTDADIVLEGNSFGDKNSIFALTAEIKRPTKALKDIKLAIQLVNGLFNDFKTETYTRFWQSINVTDEPILGYVAPKIVTELHIDILNTSLSIVRAGARPSLLSIDELYLTSMVVEQTSQVMIRLIADEVSLYLKRNKEGLEVMKNYICLVDSGLIDLDIKFSEDGRIEFGVINNVITVRACQDSLSALCELFNVMVRNSNSKQSADLNCESQAKNSNFQEEQCPATGAQSGGSRCTSFDDPAEDIEARKDKTVINQEKVNRFEMNLLEDAMNDYREEEEEEEDDEEEEEEEDAEKEDEAKSGSREKFEEDASSEEDNDTPPEIQQTATAGVHRRDPNACILDESNPSIGDLFSQPLLPTSSERMNDSAESFNSTTKSVEESGFFVIGDDDVGAGIIDKTQQEPIVRKLIDKPFSIIENHFKMTKPRTIPEILVNSLQRYVLEEMTLVVNLYGGRDFDYESSTDDNSSTNATTSEADHCDAESLHDHSGNEDVRSRAGSVASLKSKSPSNRKHCSSDSSGSLKNRRSSSRRKHLSEGSRTGEFQRSANNQTSESPKHLRFGEGAVNLWESLDLMSSPDFLGTKRPAQVPLSSDTKLAGGTWRRTDVCIQLTLSKVKMLYELGDSSGPISWRFMLFIQDIEIKDRIHASDINKMLYEYCTESMPRRNTQILTVKNIATINPSDGCEECDLKVSLKPLRLNIDQDTLLFLTEFFTAFRKSLAKQQASSAPSAYGAGTSTSRAKGGSAASVSASKPDSSSARFGTGSSSLRGGTQVAPSSEQQCSSHRGGLPINGAGRPEPVAIRRRQSSERSETDTGSISFGSCSSAASSSTGTSSSSAYLSAATQARSAATTTATTSAGTTTATTTTIIGTSTSLPTHCHSDSAAGSANQQPIYIKSFTFFPDVPIRLDYHAKHLDFEQGALAGILMGLAHLDHSELVLRRVQAKHGMRGLDRVLLFVLNSWLSDIKRNQLPSILSGVGPMHSVIQLFQGVRDLIWMPVDHYRRDRRLVRGIQRGASSFSSSTAMAAINLMNRFISIVQCTAQIAHDIVTPPAFQSNLSFAASSSLLQSNANRRRPYKLSTGGSGRHRLRRHYQDTDYYDGDDDYQTNGSHRRERLIGSGVACSSGATISSSSPITALNQPRNFYEGVAVGFTILKEGFNDTARNVALGMRSDDMRGTVGELVRTIPFTLLNPIISATEGAQNVLVGIRNQIAPDSRREDQEKWKRRVRGK